MACSVVQNTSNVSLEDCTCPICMSILIQPVTMPCTHELCMPCFRQTVEEANLCCPMCRLRIATWARLSTKQNTLVNQIRWKQIQNLFPDKVKRRLEGKDDEEDDDTPENFQHANLNIAEPGEIRREYEEQLKKLREQQATERSREEAESADLIRKLQIEEEQRRAELREREEELRLRDEELARQLAESVDTSIEEGNDSLASPESTPTATPKPTPTTTPKLSRINSKDKPNNTKTLDSFFNKQNGFQDPSLLNTSRLSRLDDSGNFSLSVKPASKGLSSPSRTELSLPSSSHSPRSLPRMPDAHREFVKNQMSVMSVYSAVNKPVNKSASATVTSQCIDVHHDQDLSIEQSSSNHDTVQLDISMSPKNVTQVSDLDVRPKRFVGLFPPNHMTDTEDQLSQLCKKHSKIVKKQESEKQKSSKTNKMAECNKSKEKEIDVNLNSETIKPSKRDKNVHFDDSDYGSEDEDIETSKSKTNATKVLNVDDKIETNINNNSKRVRSKRAVVCSSDSDSETETPPKVKKMIKRKKKVSSPPILSPQRSIKHWFSPSSSATDSRDTHKKETTANVTPLKTYPLRRNIDEMVTTSKKNAKKASPNFQSVRKARSSNHTRPERRVSKTLRYVKDDSQSVPLTSRENSLNADTKVRRSRKSIKYVSDTDSVPSPVKRRRKRSQFDSDEDSENSQTRVSKKKSTKSAKNTTPIKKNKKSVTESDTKVSVKSKSDVSKTTSPKKSNISDPESKIRKQKSVRTEKSDTKFDDSNSEVNLWLNVGTSDSEMDDHLLALKLQQQFDKEAKLARQINRAKGSDSEYLFRNKPIHSPSKSMSDTDS